MNTYQENLSSLTREEKEKRVFNLNVELADIKMQKKSTVRGFNEEIKRISEEIKEYISDDQKVANVI